MKLSYITIFLTVASISCSSIQKKESLFQESDNFLNSVNSPSAANSIQSCSGELVTIKFDPVHSALTLKDPNSGGNYVSFKLNFPVFNLSGLTVGGDGNYTILSYCKPANQDWSTVHAKTPHADSMFNISVSIFKDLLNKIQIPQPPPPSYNLSSYITAMQNTPYSGDGAEYVSSIYNNVIAPESSAIKLPSNNIMVLAAAIAGHPEFKKITPEEAFQYALRTGAFVVAVRLSPNPNYWDWPSYTLFQESKITIVNPLEHDSSVDRATNIEEAIFARSANGNLTMRMFFDGHEYGAGYWDKDMWVVDSSLKPEIQNMHYFVNFKR